jgi:hypothetical protein
VIPNSINLSLEFRIGRWNSNFLTHLLPDTERQMTYQHRKDCFQLDMSTLLPRGKEFLVTEG